MLKKFKLNDSSKGFTLIELLIVIVIIGILAGVVITVINPARQQERAAQAVLRANLDKICLAMNACGSVNTTATAGSQCYNSTQGTAFDLIGANRPNNTPTNAVYTLGWTSPDLSATATITGSTCSYTCTYETDTGVSYPPVGTGCYNN